MTPDHSPHLEELLTEVVPIIDRRRLERDVIRDEPDVVEVHYDNLNWELIDETSNIQQIEDEVVIPAGRYAGTVAATGFDGIQAELDIQSNWNTVYITTETTYVLDSTVTQQKERTLQRAICTTLQELSRKGVVEGLRPAQDVTFSDLRIYIEESVSAIQDFDLKETDAELVCRAVLRDEANPDDVLSDIRTQSGITYSKPDRLESVTPDILTSTQQPNNTSGESSTGQSDTSQSQSDNDLPGSKRPDDPQATNTPSIDELELPEISEDSEASRKAVQYAVKQIIESGEIPIRSLIETVYDAHPMGFTSPSDLYRGFLKDVLERVPGVELDGDANVWRNTTRNGVVITAPVSDLDLPGSGKRKERQQHAVQFAYNSIQQTGSIPIRTLIDHTYTNYTASYNSPSHLYKDCLKQALTELAEHDPALTYDRSTNEWQYVPPSDTER